MVASLKDATLARRTKVTTGAGQNPEQLLRVANARRADSSPEITLDELTASRLIASEHPRGSVTDWACIVDAEVNRAARKRVSLTRHLIGKTGTYGPQGRARPAATRQNSTEQHLLAARAVLSGSARGISRGAERFFDPRTQNGQNRKFRRQVDAGIKPDRVHSCKALGTLKAWSFDLPSCSVEESGKTRKRRCCSNSLPPENGKPGPKPEEWVGPIPGVDAFRLMLFKPSELGDFHTQRFEEASAIIRAKSGLPSLLDSPATHLVALLALGVLLR